MKYHLLYILDSCRATLRLHKGISTAFFALLRTRPLALFAVSNGEKLELGEAMK